MTAPEAVAALPCPRCQADVPDGNFCGVCGAHLTAEPGEGPQWLRPGTFGAAPSERVSHAHAVSRVRGDHGNLAPGEDAPELHGTRGRGRKGLVVAAIAEPVTGNMLVGRARVAEVVARDEAASARLQSDKRPGHAASLR